ncbi:hypothetical protein L6452_32892 [Arctium lappa]|uniref:Uncharacterized protein n=1 Tax=Arctium lappa TaxID=4217 RepID=A0ACB8Z5X3_ARCLA|nr:hypothetical protein L6452_32892 [Arctium lappa]
MAPINIASILLSSHPSDQIFLKLDLSQLQALFLSPSLMVSFSPMVSIFSGPGSPPEDLLLKSSISSIIWWLFKDVASDLISLPMPTIAAVTDHATAAGLLLAMSHDYILMRQDRGVLYLSEIDMGMALPNYFTALIRSKVAKPESQRDLLLCGVRVKAEEAVAKGLIDSAHDSGEKAVEAVVRLGEELTKRKWDDEVYAEIRKSLYTEIYGVLSLTKVFPSSPTDPLQLHLRRPSPPASPLLNSSVYVGLLFRPVTIFEPNYRHLSADLSISLELLMVVSQEIVDNLTDLTTNLKVSICVNIEFDDATDSFLAQAVEELKLEVFVETSMVARVFAKKGCTT